jgi:hypothetical protein
MYAITNFHPSAIMVQHVVALYGYGFLRIEGGARNKDGSYTFVGRNGLVGRVEFSATHSVPVVTYMGIGLVAGEMKDLGDVTRGPARAGIFATEEHDAK